MYTIKDDREKIIINLLYTQKRGAKMTTFILGPKIYMGDGNVPTALDGCQKVLVVADEFMNSSGMVKYVTDYLDGAKVEYQIFSDIQADPDIETVKAGLVCMASLEPDCIIAFGGGSSIDAAKAIKFFWEQKEGNIKPKLVVIPTTSGTGSEVSSYAVITDKKEEVKYPLTDDSLLADSAILDAKLVVSVPPVVTADTGIDALGHAVEAFVSINQTDFSDAMAEKAIELICKHLPTAYKDPQNMEARQAVHNASCMAGVAFNNAGLGLTHAMAHPLGAHFHIPHGRAIALLLPYVMNFNAGCSTVLTKTANRYAELARLLYLDVSGTRQSALSFIRSVRFLIDKVGIPTRIRDAGIDKVEFEEALDSMATDALSDATYATTPVTVSKQEIIDLYRSAFNGRF